MSADGGKSGVFSPTGTTANALLPLLKSVLDGMADQHESMKEIVAALQDSDKGKSASLASLLAQHQERNPAELLTSQSEVIICCNSTACSKRDSVLTECDTWLEIGYYRKRSRRLGGLTYGILVLGLP